MMFVKDSETYDLQINKQAKGKKGEAISVTRRGGSYILLDIGSQMAIRSSALLVSRSLSPGSSPVLISVRN
jgi:hypothetical protein